MNSRSRTKLGRRGAIARRTILAVLLVSSTLVAVAIAGVATASATTVDIPATQFNLCGNKCFNEDPKLTLPADRLVPAQHLAGVALGSSPRPWIVTVNELCDNQYFVLATSLGPQGYSSYRSNTVNVGGNCGMYGNGLFMLGNNNGDGIDEVIAPPAGEQRRIMCKPHAGFVTFVGCVTHLTTQQASKDAQVNFVRNRIAAVFGNTNIVVLGGDFNTDSSAAIAQDEWNVRDWVVSPMENSATIRTSQTIPYTAKAPTLKIDRFFGRNQSPPPLTARTPASCAAAKSDHCLIQDVARWSSSSAPFGAVDVTAHAGGNSVSISGWTIDPDTVGATDVHVYLGWPGNHPYGFNIGAANLSRPDVASAFGYGKFHGYGTVVTPPAWVTEACLYAIDRYGGGNVLMTCRPIS